MTVDAVSGVGSGVGTMGCQWVQERSGDLTERSRGQAQRGTRNAERVDWPTPSAQSDWVESNGRVGQAKATVRRSSSVGRLGQGTAYGASSR